EPGFQRPLGFWRDGEFEGKGSALPLSPTVPDGWLEPLGLITGPAAQAAVQAGEALPFQGGPAAFLMVRPIGPEAPPPCRIAELPDSWRDKLLPLTRPPPAFLGLGATRPLVMGIVNLTPDSFSGDGLADDPAEAIARGEAMREAGADLLDLGAESTRPGAEPVPPEEERRRLLPVLRALAPGGPVTVDTRNAATMAAALEAGAAAVNDISALRHDPGAATVLARLRAPVVLMHMLGTDPRTMQREPRYADVALEVACFLRDRVATAERLGIPRSRIAVDPGIGFGKTMAHNLELLRRLPLLAGLGCPILVGASRKGFIGRLSGEAEAGQRLGGSVAAALFAAAQGATILRVHDVAETAQALRVWRACAA
ncbi:MAG TPA: dihydropteroate synthase, partial [Crenalkalicoccus sp.]|nr:dihydropteroate synthase [Crenalkalicoccus sp.]